MMHHPDVSKSSSTSSKISSATGQILETKPSKASSKVKQPSKVKSTKKQGDITVTEQALHQNRPKIPTPMLDELLGTKSIQSDTIKHDAAPKTHQTTSVLLDNLLKQNPKLDDLLGGKSKKKQKAILYDLLVQEGKLGTKPQQDYSFVFDHTQKLATEQTPKTTQRTRTKTTKPPVSIKIPEIGIRKNRTPEKKRKGAAKYSIWNVDADNIGTLPGEELVTSESTKIFKDLDKRQKAHNKPTNKSKNTTRKTTKKAIKKPAKKKSSKRTRKMDYHIILFSSFHLLSIFATSVTCNSIYFLFSPKLIIIYDDQGLNAQHYKSKQVTGF